MTHRPYRAQIGYRFAFVLALFISGCGGGAAPLSETPAPTLPAAETLEISATQGNIVVVEVGDTVTLDGSYARTTPRETITYSWSFTSKPDLSTTKLENTTAMNPTFFADVRGTYMVQLVISARGVSSLPTIALVEVVYKGETLPNLQEEHRRRTWTDCSICHGDDPDSVVGKSPDHIATSNLCEACHSILGFASVPFVDHEQVFGICADCHNGKLAVGKSDIHVLTQQACDNCHTTISFLYIEPDGSYNHSEISSGCARCHNTVLAIGFDYDHISTTLDCIECHTKANFKPANFDHSAVTENCAKSGCHTGLDGEAIGAERHPDINLINLDCSVCHNTETFIMGNVFNHAIIISRELLCQACHEGDNAVATVKTPDHEITNVDCAMCHNTSGFTPAFINHGSDAVTSATSCAFCHDGEPITGKPPGTHMTTVEDCDWCHTLGTFTTGVFDHVVADVLITADCVSCHNDVIVSGLPFNHIPVPTNVNCGMAGCHNTTNFADVGFSHDGIVNNCVECHNGLITTGLTTNHLPIDVPTGNMDCALCHTYTTANTFTGAVFNHTGVDRDCAYCHDNSYDFGKDSSGVDILGGKPVRTHIPTQDDCILCHDVGTAFQVSTFYSDVHINIVRGCEGCHNGQFATVVNGPVTSKANTHLPTDQDCDVCHTITVFTPSTFAHVDISGNCNACHNGSYVEILGPKGIGATGATDTAVHTNATTNGIDCAACHNTQTFNPDFTDHSSAAVRSVSCESCHDGTTATGKQDKLDGPHVETADDCGLCHLAGGGFVPAVYDHSSLPRTTRCDLCHGVTATGKSAKTNPAHIQTTEDCKLCHNTTAFAGAKFDHQGIVANCVACHGKTAIGKSNNHVPTTDDCSVCHETTGFVPATFAHVGIDRNCVACHDNVFAIGKDAATNHPPTNSDCGACHSVTGQFLDGQMDHTGITNNCARSGCHTGLPNEAIGKNVGHLDTALDCFNCHTTATFVGGTWFHGSDTVGRCKDCHFSGRGATPQPPTGVNGHFDTTQQCDVCHTTSGWAPARRYIHRSGSNYPGNHNSRVGCINCHTNNSQTIDYTLRGRDPDPQYQGFCASCHAGDFSPQGDHNGGTNGTLAQNKNCGASDCHRVNGNGF